MVTIKSFKSLNTVLVSTKVTPKQEAAEAMLNQKYYGLTEKEYETLEKNINSRNCSNDEQERYDAWFKHANTVSAEAATGDVIVNDDIIKEAKQLAKCGRKAATALLTSINKAEKKTRGLAREAKKAQCRANKKVTRMEIADRKEEVLKVLEQPALSCPLSKIKVDMKSTKVYDYSTTDVDFNLKPDEGYCTDYECCGKDRNIRINAAQKVVTDIQNRYNDKTREIVSSIQELNKLERETGLKLILRQPSINRNKRYKPEVSINDIYDIRHGKYKAKNICDEKYTYYNLKSKSLIDSEFNSYNMLDFRFVYDSSKVRKAFKITGNGDRIEYYSKLSVKLKDDMSYMFNLIKEFKSAYADIKKEKEDRKGGEWITVPVILEQTDIMVSESMYNSTLTKAECPHCGSELRLISNPNKVGGIDKQSIMAELKPHTYIINGYSYTINDLGNITWTNDPEVEYVPSPKKDWNKVTESSFDALADKRDLDDGGEVELSAVDQIVSHYYLNGGDGVEDADDNMFYGSTDEETEIFAEVYKDHMLENQYNNLRKGRSIDFIKTVFKRNIKEVLGDEILELFPDYDGKCLTTEEINGHICVCLDNDMVWSSDVTTYKLLNNDYKSSIKEVIQDFIAGGKYSKYIGLDVSTSDSESNKLARNITSLAAFIGKIDTEEFETIGKDFLPKFQDWSGSSPSALTRKGGTHQAQIQEELLERSLLAKAEDDGDHDYTKLNINYDKEDITAKANGCMVGAIQISKEVTDTIRYNRSSNGFQNILNKGKTLLDNISRPKVLVYTASEPEVKGTDLAYYDSEKLYKCIVNTYIMSTKRKLLEVSLEEEQKFYAEYGSLELDNELETAFDIMLAQV